MLTQRDLQVGVYGKLTGDAGLMAKITGVFDVPPENQAFPYVTLSAIETHENAFERDGRMVDQTIDVWSQYSGYKEAQEIGEIICDLLNHQTVTVGSKSLVFMQFRQARTIRQNDGLTVQLNLEFEVFIQE